MLVVPKPVAARFPLYLRQLEEYEADGVALVSSRELGAKLGTSAAQVRKDLACFGHFGLPGVGYPVKELVEQLKRIIGRDHRWRVALVGAGNLGRALCRYKGFLEKGFEILAVFDKDRSKIGKHIGPKTIRPMSEFARTVRGEHIELGVIAVPAREAQAVAKQMVKAGIRGILNFAPVRLTVPEGVTVCAVDLAVELQQLSFSLKSGEPALPAAN